MIYDLCCIWVLTSTFHSVCYHHDFTNMNKKTKENEVSE